MQVRVYFNLHKKRFSIQHKVNGRWRLLSHADRVELIDVQFKVYETGRQRVLREKAKNVHAYVIGRLEPHAHDESTMRGARYNPYHAGHFTDITTGARIDQAAFAVLHLNGDKGRIAYI